MHPTTRRALLGAGALLAAAPAFAQTALPDRPLRMILPVGPGGLTDAVGRILADQMGAALGRTVVPENAGARAARSARWRCCARRPTA